MSSEHKDLLKTAGLYADVQHSLSTNLGWLAQRLQDQCNIEFPDTDGNAVDSNELDPPQQYSSLLNSEQHLRKGNVINEIFNDIRLWLAPYDVLASGAAYASS